ncbi:MAG TPA: rhamnulokinase, partial [Vicinamibacteria bacterium]|nr:rhamnulokinase [Vicinamibacteria bacterium]
MATPEAASFHVAIDLGAGSGRAMLGRLLVPDGRAGGPALVLEEVHRFHYPPAQRDGHLRWPFQEILDGIKAGLCAASRAAAVHNGAPETLGVDSWGVDYGLVDAAGRLLEDPVCYRDHRTDG